MIELKWIGEHMATLASFTKQYQVQKTLRFELVPQGKTQENINAKDFINDDKQRNENYQKVKTVIDNLHKEFIEGTLNEAYCDWSMLATAIKNYRKDRCDTNKKSLLKTQEAARKEIIAWFEGKRGNSAFKNNQKSF